MDKKINELKNKTNFSVDDLRDIMVVLRSENGCPWDKVQTHKTIRQDLLEEAYETAEAIDVEDSEMLCEELGDVLLQVAFHTAIAEESGEFSFNDVCNGVCRKMIERHPHVFGNVEVDGVDGVLTNWDAIKQKSKKREGLYEQLDGVCKALPALMLAAKYINKLNKSGIETECLEYDGDVSEDLIGEMLYKTVALAKKNNIDAEKALQKKCEKLLQKLK